MSEKFEGTRGPWTVRAGIAVGAEVVGKKAKGGDYVVARCSGSDRDKNAALIAEAGNVANTTGLTPRQLAEQRAALLEAAKLVRDYVVTMKGRGHEYQESLDAAIALAQGDAA